ncbi:MAG TPA: proteasome ATPase, partial [Pseudonocardiaceae bacterium]|nr:proteasome ATPase [Pseudonocardiaceae bacterium]
MHDRPGGRSEGPEDRERSVAELNRQIGFLEDEVALLRRKLTESPRHVRLLEERLADASARVSQLTERNAKLIDTLKDARNQLMALREEVDRLAQPPSGYGVFISAHDDGTVDVFTAGRKMRVAVSPTVQVGELNRGQSVRLNEALTVVEAGRYETTGEVVALREVLTD